MDESVKNAVIEHAEILIEDHGLLSMDIRLDYGGSVQSFGGYAFYSDGWDIGAQDKGGAFLGLFIWRLLKVVGVRSLSALKGSSVRAHLQGGLVIGIGHLLEDKWFFPREDRDKREKAKENDDE